MATMSIGILGGVIGKVGTVVGYKMNGVNYLRARVAHIKNPKTTKQEAERGRMKAVVLFASGLLSSLIHPMWKREGRLSGFNRFVQSNIPAFGADGTVSDPSKLIFSKGKLLIPQGLAAASAAGAGGKVTLSWTPEQKEGLAAADDVLKVVTWFNGEATVFSNITDTRSSGTASVNLPYASGSKVNIFAFFGDKDGKQYSNEVMTTVTLG